MEKLNNFFLEKLEEQLFKLPSWKESKVREDSWMTSLEIAEWHAAEEGSQYHEDLIEDFLIDNWEKNELKNIRPAKYPHSKNNRTLWGHVQRVYPLEKNNIQLRKINPKLYLSQNKLSTNSPIIFISHSLRDFEFAKQISDKINEGYGYRTWLCEKKLGVNSYINQEIRISISQCDALVVLLTFNSLGSAYVHTEIETAVDKVIPVIKNDDNDLMEVVAVYEENPLTANLNPLIEKYKQTKPSEHQCFDPCKTRVIF